MNSSSFCTNRENCMQNNYGNSNSTCTSDYIMCMHLISTLVIVGKVGMESNYTRVATFWKLIFCTYLMGEKSILSQTSKMGDMLNNLSPPILTLSFPLSYSPSCSIYFHLSLTLYPPLSILLSLSSLSLYVSLCLSPCVEAL